MQDSDPKQGRKFDSGKPRMSLIPPYAAESIAKVLTIGAIKYAPDNWKYVEGRDWRYFDALYRHLNAHAKGELNDPESGLPHLAHAGCCLMFMLDEQVRSPKKDVTTSGTNSVSIGNAISGSNYGTIIGANLTTAAYNNTTFSVMDPGTVTGIVR
jgi:hypothetical protein